MTKAERDYLLINNPDMLRALERGSSGAREWLACNQSAINEALRYGNGPTAQQVADRERFERENRGAAGN